MEQFIVSARKYRPNSFESLIGQENIAATLKNSIIRGQLAHAYLFCGPRGVGKTSTARIFAKSINCMNPSPEMEPCGECESCRSFAEGRSYCIHELDAASNNSVDDIRNLTDMVRIPPQIGKYSVYIIDEVHMLSAAAFNAFLKTLEEPPAHAIFILATTEKHKILPTILSRCQTYDFNRISIPDIVSNLTGIAKQEGITIDSDTMHIIAMKADGSMRDALTLFDQTVAFCGKDVKYEDVIKNLNVLDYEYYFKMVDNSLNKDYIASLILFDEILSKGFNALHFISGLSSHLRDLIVCKNNAAEFLLSLPPTLVAKYREQSSRCSVPFIYNALSVTTACEAAYRQSGNQRLLIEFALMKLALGQSAGTGAATAPAQAQRPAAAPVTGAAPAPAQQKPQAPAEAPAAASNPVAAPVVEEQKPQAAPEIPAAAANPAAAPVIAEQKPQAAPEAPAAAANPVPAPAPAEQKSSAGPEPDKDSSPAGGLSFSPVKGMSLKDMMKAAEAAAIAESQKVDEGNEPFSRDKFMDVWEDIIEGEKNAGRVVLGNTLGQYTPEIDEDHMKIVFFVSNSSQLSWVKEKCLQRFITMVRAKMRNGRIDMNVDVAPQLQGEKDVASQLYMPTQKAQYMLEKNEELREIAKDLNLDIK